VEQGPTDPNRFDPWAGHRFGGIRWFAFSTAAHLGLLVLFATVTLTVMRQVEEIRVKVVDDAPVGPEATDGGAPSLQDLAGVLRQEKAAPQRAAPSGPVIEGVRAPDMPRVGGVGPKLGTGPAIEAVATGLGGGSGLSIGGGGGGGLGGLGGGFGDYVGGLRKVGLDVALVIDTTDSMQFVIDDVKAKLSALVASIQRMVPTSRIGIVVYRDKGDDYVVKWTDLSFNTKKLQDFLAGISARGGGDWEEAVKEAMDAAVNDLKWRKQSKRMIILVGGSPPHQVDESAIRRVVRDFREDGGYVSAIDVTHRLHDDFERNLWKSLHGSKPYEPKPMPDYFKETARAFTDISRDGGGELVVLDQDKALMRSILELTFGSRWKTEMAKYLNEIS